MLPRSLLLLLVLSPSLLAQAKRPLTHADADGWRGIGSASLSRDGKFVAYSLAPQEGDGEYVVRNLQSAQEWHIPTAGVAGVAAPAARAGTRTPAVASRAAFTADGRLAVFSVSPTKAEIARAAADKKDPPKAGILLLELASGQMTRIEGARTWMLPGENGTFLAYLREPKTAVPPKDPKEPPPNPRPNPVRPTTPTRTYGSELVLLNLANRSERTFSDVVEFSFTKDSKALVYTVSSKTEENNGVYLAVPGLSAPPVALLAGKGRYQRLTWDEGHNQLAFFAEPGDTSTATPHRKVYHWERRSMAVSFALPATLSPVQALVGLTAWQAPAVSAGKATEIVSTGTPGFKSGWSISDRGVLGFTRDGNKLLLSVAPVPAATATSTEPRSDLDLWHWQDDYIQPMQKLRAEGERSRSFRAVYHIKEKRYLQLADETLPDVNLIADSGLALGMDDKPYRRLVGRESVTGYSDFYLVNTLEGTRTPLTKKVTGGVSVSPAGKYLLSFEGKDWHALAVANGKSVNLTGKIGVAFQDEEHDKPEPPRPYGLLGWTANDAAVLLYDRYDIWQINPDGSGGKNLTGGLGRKIGVSFRYLPGDVRERAIDPDKPMLLAAENLHTRDQGFYRLVLKNGPPRCLMMAARAFSAPVKAPSADVYLLTAQSFNEPPDLFVSDLDFKEMKKVSNANPQKKDLLWGNAELIDYKSDDGKALQAVLVKPENFQPGKKYPMIVYIYERLSGNLHRFNAPRPGTTINPSYYASNGYLVLMPDIAYTIGSPGQSALKCVLPAVNAVASTGILDEKAIGIQGHSWGGYQIAYLITQTNRFKAAVAGAPVSDMVSAYGGIRWGTGLSRQFQYEQSQSRIGGTLWQRQSDYLENSPIFKADRVHTPLMMLHNDQDDAVPWYQGIEYYMALRRLDREVYLLNYNGERHGLTKRVNQKDYTVKMQEFFDHHLKGTAKPTWMEKGVPYLERIKNGPLPPAAVPPPAAPGEEEQP